MAGTTGLEPATGVFEIGNDPKPNSFPDLPIITNGSRHRRRSRAHLGGQQSRNFLRRDGLAVRGFAYLEILLRWEGAMILGIFRRARKRAVAPTNS